MRTILSLSIFLIACLSAHAQKVTDRIYRVDKTHFEAVVDEITDNEIIYLKPDDVSGSNKIKIARDEVWKIVFSDGETEVITPIREVLDAPVAQSEATAATDAGTSVEKSVNKGAGLKNATIDDPDKKRILFSVGADAAYVINALEWTDDAEGMGMELGFGASASLTVPISRWLGIMASGGLLKWEILRNFRDSASDELLFKRTNTFNMVPIHLGLKIYPVKGLYLAPQAGYTIYEETGADQKPDAESVSFFDFKGGKVGYRGEIGYEQKVNRLLFSLSAHYSSMFIQNMNQFRNIPPLNYFGGRLSVGYSF